MPMRIDDLVKKNPKQVPYTKAFLFHDNDFRNQRS